MHPNKLSLVREGEVAERLGVSVLTVRKWRFFSRGPRFMRVGGRAVRYDPADIDAWIAAQPQGGEPEEVAK